MKLIALYCLLLVSVPSLIAQNVVISEFLARNDGVLMDEDGEASDWIELNNREGVSVNLEGWFLTDTTNDLRKWRFPSTNIGPNGYLVVFASGKNRTNTGSLLHANFSLGGAGEYLGLIRPDGSVAQEYRPTYPAQEEDISYGLAQDVTSQNLISAGAAARYLVPSGDLGTSWKDREFADSSWASGQSGFGFSEATGSSEGLYSYWPMNEGAGGSISNAVSAGAMGTLNGATWFNDPQRGAVLSFNGMNAYVSAGRIPRMGRATSNFTWSFWYKQNTAPGPNTVVIGNRSGGTQSPLQFIKFTPTNFEYYNGGNAGFIPMSTPNGVWRHLVVVKNGASATYYVNGVASGSSTITADNESNPFYMGGDPGAAGEYSNGYIDDVSLWTRALTAAEVNSLSGGASPLNLSPYASVVATDIKSAMHNVNASAYFRFAFNLSENDAFNTLRLKVKYDDGFVGFINGVEVARRNAPASVSWNSAATAERIAASALVFEEIDISAHVGELVDGTNVLAFQALNSSSGDGDLLLLPELVAAQVVTSSERYFATPTPGTFNDPGFLGFVADTKFSHDRGFYETNFDLTIICATPGATIRYTTNGTAPTATSGILYSGPIPINRTTVVLAQAYKAGYEPSDVDAQTYIYLDNVLTQTGAGFPTTWNGVTPDYAMDRRVVTNAAYASTIRDDLKSLPVVSIVTDTASFFGPSGIYANPTRQGAAYEIPASAEMFFPDGSRDGFQINCGLRISGGASRNPGLTPKHGVRLLFKGIYGDTKLRYQFFENTERDTFDSIAFRPNFNMSWVRTDNSGPLNNGNSDGAERTHAIYVRDQFTKDSYLAMGAVGAHERFVHLYINGLYWGLYNPCERTDASFAAHYFGGEKEEWDAIFSDLSAVARPVDGTKEAWNTMLGIANAGLQSPAAYANIQRYLDVTNLADYMMLNFYASTVDWPWQNWNALRKRDETGRFRFIVWDAEYTIETPPWVPEDRTGVGTAGNEGDSPARLYNQLRANAEWRLLFADRAHKHFFNNGALTTNQTIPRFVGLTDTIDRAIVGESARWGDVVRTSNPYTRNVEWVAEKNRLLTQFFPGRTDKVIQQLKNAGLYPNLAAPSFNRHGGTFGERFHLAISAPEGAIYYTINLTDPRLEGGAVSPDAIPYTGSFYLYDSTRVKARVLHNGTWSALNEADFISSRPPAIRVTEIMANPAAPLAGSMRIADDYQFIEVKNVSATTISLGGLAFTRGVTFNFPNIALAPGQFAVVVKNLEAFVERYGSSNGVVGQFQSGTLAVNAETLRLEGAFGQLLEEVTYDPEWYALSDGNGFSLVRRNPDDAAGNLSDRDAWRTSSQRGGSPGSEDPAANPGYVVINEVLSHSVPPAVDAIELHNTHTSAVDVSGWLLSDQRGTPFKFRIPDGSVIPAGGYIYFEEPEFNPATNAAGFALSSRGDELHLFSADALTNLTGYAHSIEFGAAAAGVSLGRVKLSTGAEEFMPQEVNTFGLANSSPVSPRVRITEIMYHSLDGNFEYVELQNVSGAALDISGWNFQGTDLSFPAATTLAANEIIVAANTNEIALRALYNIPAGVRVFTFTGALQNEGETLSIAWPDQSQVAPIPFVDEDRVKYNDRGAWPRAADGGGLSIHRSHPGIGSEPTNWVAAAPSPGAVYTSGGAPVITQGPDSATVIGFSDHELNAISSANASYLWLHNGNVVPAATNASLILTNVQESDAGEYQIVAYNNFGSTVSAAALIEVRMPAVITLQPQSVGGRAGANFVLRVEANSGSPMAFQWFRDGEAITGATNASLAVTNIQVQNGIYSHDYFVRITDDVAAINSRVATVTVLVNPIVSAPPQPVTVLVGERIVLSVSATGTPPITYAWRKNGAFIPETNQFLIIENARTNDAGAYAVVLRNPGIPSGVLSQGGIVTVLVDTDGDGLADVWERANGFSESDPADGPGDVDADGLSNRNEFIAGTNPRDPASKLALLMDTSNQMQFNAVSNKNYSVQYSHTLASNSWFKLQDILSRSTNRTITVQDTNPSQASRFYRIITPRALE